MSALRRSSVVLLALAWSLSGPLQAGSEARALNSYDRGVVERVRARAVERLDDARCAQVLADFTDREGRTLESNLRSRGQSAAAHLQQLAFVDGSHLPVCRRLNVAMATTPGGLQVFVCPAGIGRANSRLSHVELQSGTLAEAMMIHEMLHTLGLGENPPTTFEITRQVRARCG